MGDLAQDTAVQGSDGSYGATLSRDWEIWGPNGGYVAAITLRAAGAATRMSRPATFACHFLGVAEFAAVELTVTTLRASKRAESLRVSMRQQGRAIAEAIVWCVGEADGIEHDFAMMPAVPNPGALRSMEELCPPEALAQRHRFWGNFEVRPINYVPWNERQPGEPAWQEWYRFRPQPAFDDPFVDAARSVVLVDTMVWPASCRAHRPDGLQYIAPSLDVTVQFHRPAAHAPWLLADAIAPVASGGLIGGSTRVWSEDGHLVASGGSQLICRPLPVSAA